MISSDEKENNISRVLDFLMESEYGTDDYNLGCKTIFKLLEEDIEEKWNWLEENFGSKKEAFYHNIIDRLIDVNNDYIDVSIKPYIIANIIKYDAGLVDYCKAQIHLENNSEIEIINRIRHKLDFLRKVVKLC